MFDSIRFDSLRPLLVSVIAATALSACGDKAASSANGNTTAAQGSSEYLIEGDHVMGRADAPVTLVEYASVSCGACANWHTTVYPELKKKYIDTGKVKYVFREFIAGPPELADAGFMIALCAPKEDYFKNIELQFKRQSQIFDMVNQGKAREAYVSLSKASGLTEDEFIACMSNQEIRDRYRATMQTGVDMGVNKTPTMVINGKVSDAFTLEQIEEVILPILGEPLPEKTEGAPE